MTEFYTLVAQKNGAMEISLDYLICDSATGNFNAVYSSCEEKLKNCVVLNWDNFCTDNKVLYSFYVEHIGTIGIGSFTVKNKYKHSKNGYKCQRKVYKQWHLMDRL